MHVLKPYIQYNYNQLHTYLLSITVQNNIIKQANEFKYLVIIFYEYGKIDKNLA
jgi:hypothetical protein